MFVASFVLCRAKDREKGRQKDETVQQAKHNDGRNDGEKDLKNVALAERQNKN